MVTRRTESRLSAPSDKGVPDRQFVPERGDRLLPAAESAVERVGQDKVVVEAAAQEREAGWGQVE